MTRSAWTRQAMFVAGLTITGMTLIGMRYRVLAQQPAAARAGRASRRPAAAVSRRMEAAAL